MWVVRTIAKAIQCKALNMSSDSSFFILEELQMKHVGFLVGVFVILLLAGLPNVPVVPVRGQEQPMYGGTLIIALPGNPSTLNDAITTARLARMVAPSVLESLIRLQPDSTPLPNLARSWEVSPDGKTYTFHLVRNATWHDGVAFTSADVQYTFMQVLTKFQSEWISINAAYGPITVDTPDPYTAVLHLARFYNAVFIYLSEIEGPMLPKHLYEGTDILNNPYNLKPVGTGPFMFSEYFKGDHITMVKNPNYWRKGLPYLDQIIFRIIPDTTARVLALEKGEVDLINHPGFPVAAAAELSKNPNITVTQEPTILARQQQIFINLRPDIPGLLPDGTLNVLSDLRVRQALAYGMDRQTILQQAAYGYGKVGDTCLHSFTPIYQGVYYDGPALPRYEYNVTKANALLDQAGYARAADGTTVQARHARQQR